MAKYAVKIPLKQAGTPHKFDPSDLSIAAGDAVEWTNEDNEDHTVTSDDGSGTLDGFLSGKGAKYSKTFTEKGDVPYHCDFHGTMTAVIRVK